MDNSHLLSEQKNRNHRQFLKTNCVQIKNSRVWFKKNHTQISYKNNRV